VDIIRPLAFVEEDTIIKYTRKLNLPVTNCGCRLYSVKTDPKRLETKVLIKNLEKKNPTIRKSIMHAIFSDTAIQMPSVSVNDLA
jgi:tRNA(Ile)-lysidine synthase TilS/MesJ